MFKFFYEKRISQHFLNLNPKKRSLAYAGDFLLKNEEKYENL